MWDFIVTALLMLLSAILAFDSFQKWRTMRGIWYILALAVAVVAIPLALVNWADTVFTIILALILRAVAGAAARRK